MTMQVENPEPTISDVLTAIAALQTRMDENDKRLTEEVKRWDERFFKFAEDSVNRSNTLIASATISVIAGVVLLLLRQS
jgi:hypothetical protein